MADPYLSEIKFLGAGNQDFIEIVVDAGTDVSNIQVVVYNPDGTVRTTNSLGTLVTTVAGQDVYVIDQVTSATFNGVHKNGALALVDNGTVTSFVSFNKTVTATEGPADGMSSTQIGTTSGGESLESTDGTTYTVQSTPNPGTVPCFAEGSLILTDTGYRPVETLSAGDLVATADNGPQPLRWIGSRQIKPASANAMDYRPICIPSNSFGPGCPETDLLVSPNHRVKLTHPQCVLLFASREILVPAKTLLWHGGIYRATRFTPFRYFHLLFDQHEILFSNGLQTESFHPAHIGLSAFEPETRDEVLGLFPNLQTGENGYGRTARLSLKPFEADVLMNALFNSDNSVTTIRAA
ncbi:MAG: Hint domain-containing protein [Rhodobacteraceae bacterium]|nr:Hint domain-containing protein [Paracoccaceae bacterium]